MALIAEKCRFLGWPEEYLKLDMPGDFPVIFAISHTPCEKFLLEAIDIMRCRLLLYFKHLI